MSEVQIDNALNNELFDQYSWYEKVFLYVLQMACSEFFNDLFSLHLVSISKNINILFQGDDYFVTKVRVDKQHDVFFRCSSEGIKIILDRLLGQTKKFNIANITELEAKIISSFNDYLYNNLLDALLPPPPKDQKRKNFDTIHVTLFIKDNQSNEAAKLIVSVPEVLLDSKIIEKHPGKYFDTTDFKKSPLEVNIKVGTTKFPLKEIKSIEREDIVIFENSDIHSMALIYKDYYKNFKINPNPGLITSIDNDNGGNNMDENSLSQDLWDNIQVEMGAEFEKVKITLGELKNIEQGLVLDLASVYDNKISLKVEDKTIAKGELIIINDRYGVRIDEVFSDKQQESEVGKPLHQQDDTSDAQIEQKEDAPAEPKGEDDEEFDYSDFELDDQDI